MWRLGGNVGSVDVGSAWNLVVSNHAVLVGLLIFGLPSTIKFWVKKSGLPEYKRVVVVKVQPPMTMSTALGGSLRNMRPLPIGMSQATALVKRLRGVSVSLHSNVRAYVARSSKNSCVCSL